MTFEMLAAYTGAADPGGRFGWYTPGDSDDLNELFTIPSTDVQRINPRTTAATSRAYTPPHTATSRDVLGDFRRA